MKSDHSWAKQWLAKVDSSSFLFSDSTTSPFVEKEAAETLTTASVEKGPSLAFHDRRSFLVQMQFSHLFPGIIDEWSNRNPIQRSLTLSPDPWSFKDQRPFMIHSSLSLRFRAFFIHRIICGRQSQVMRFIKKKSMMRGKQE